MIVALEGIEGCGKTTQAFLMSQEFNAPVLKFPDYKRTPVLEQYMHKEIELDPRASFMLFLADIVEGTKNMKNTVIIDRYFYSTVAYAKFDFNRAKKIPELLEMRHADLVVLMDITAEEGVERKTGQKKSLDRYESDLNFLKRIRDNYTKLAKEQYMGKWAVIDGTKKPIEIFNEIKKAMGKAH